MISSQRAQGLVSCLKSDAGGQCGINASTVCGTTFVALHAKQIKLSIICGEYVWAQMIGFVISLCWN